MTTSSSEERMARVEGSFEQVGRRLETVEQDIRDLRAEVRQDIRTLITITVAMWVTTMLAVLSTLAAVLLK